MPTVLSQPRVRGGFNGDDPGLMRKTEAVIMNSGTDDNVTLAGARINTEVTDGYADEVYDEYDRNGSMQVLTTHDPIKGGLNAIAHYFSTGVAFMYMLIYMASTGLMYIWITAFETTSFLQEIQVEAVTLAFQALALLVPLIINRFNSEAENAFSSTVRAYGRAMEWTVDYAINLNMMNRVVVDASVKQQRNVFIRKQLQYVKLLHYLVYITYVSNRIDLIFTASGADLSVLGKGVEQRLRELKTQGIASFFRGILGFMMVDAIQAMQDDVIIVQEYNLLNSVLMSFRSQAASMAAGSLPVKNKILKNHQYLVVGVYLFVVVPVSIHNIVERYSLIFYGPLMVLLVSNMTIPYWLGNITDSSMRFTDAEFINKRHNVYEYIKSVESTIAV